MRRFFRMALAGWRLLVAEFRRGPRAGFRLIADGVGAMFGKSAALDRYRDSPVIQDVRRAATERRRRAALRRRHGLWRRRLSLQMALGVLREGRVLEAERMLRDSVRVHRDDPELAAALDRVDGERVVLSGEWSPRTTARPLARRARGRVLHVVGKSLPYTTAGYTVRTQGVIRSQREVGFEPIVVTKLGFPGAEQGVGAVLEDVEGIRHIRLDPTGDVPSRWDLRLDRHLELLEQTVDAQEPALLQAHSDFENALLALAVGSSRSVPVVYEVRGFWEETWLSKSTSRSQAADRYRLRREREAECVQRADLVITLSSTMAERVVADGVDSSRIVVVPNAVDPDRFPRVEDPDSELRSSLGVDGADLVIGYVTSLVAYEGVATLIDAVGLMARRGLDVRAVIVGDGEERPSLEHQARSAGIQHRVVFTGAVPHKAVARYYAALDVFVIPRRDDRVCRLVTPIKPFEALSVGRPLVVSNVAPLAEIVRESEAGLTFAAGDAGDLAGVLAELADDRERRVGMGRRGASWVRENRSWQSNGQRYLEAFSRFGLLRAQ